MFYCSKCYEEYDLPWTPCVSRGACEICGTVDDCYDIPTERVNELQSRRNLSKTPYAINDTVLNHVDHNLVISSYRDRFGNLFNISVECEDCKEVVVELYDATL